ncbi:MAG: O-antigen ligase family protein [bacterium]|nr:O-antigen ligase family protein [bacterium]
MTIFKYTTAAFYLSNIKLEYKEKYEKFISILAIVVAINLFIAGNTNSNYYILKGNPLYSGVLFVCGIIFLINKKNFINIFLIIILLLATLYLENRASLILLAFSLLGIKNLRFLIYAIVIVVAIVSSKKLITIDELGRINIYLTALKAFMEKPLTGWGAGMFEVAYEKNKLPFFSESPSLYYKTTKFAHNQILELLVENGLLVTIIVGYILYFYLKNSIRNYHFYFCLGFLFISLFSSPFFHLFSTLIFLTSTTYSSRILYIKESKMLKKFFFAFIIFPGIFLIGKIFGLLNNYKIAKIFDFLNSTWDLKLVDTYRKKGDIILEARYILDAIKKDKNNHELYHKLAHIFEEINPNYAIISLENAIKVAPYNIHLKLEFATMLEKYRYIKKADEVLKECIKLEYNAPLVYKVYADFLYRHSKPYYKYYKDLYEHLKTRKYSIKSEYEKLLTE